MHQHQSLGTRMLSKLTFVALLLLSLPAGAQQTEIKSVDRVENQLVWTNATPGTFSEIQRSTNLTTGPWSTVFYDWATNGLFATPIPATAFPEAYYRVQVQTNVPDPSLVMHLSFDNRFSDGAVIDVSGQGNHGLRY